MALRILRCCAAVHSGVVYSPLPWDNFTELVVDVILCKKKEWNNPYLLILRTLACSWKLSWCNGRLSTSKCSSPIKKSFMHYTVLIPKHHIISQIHLICTCPLPHHRFSVSLLSCKYCIPSCSHCRVSQYTCLSRSHSNVCLRVPCGWKYRCRSRKGPESAGWTQIGVKHMGWSPSLWRCLYSSRAEEVLTHPPYILLSLLSIS